MRLKNKKTGEINLGDLHLDNFDSLAELNEEWEDVPEEPKEYWYIDYDGGILCSKPDKSSAEKMMISMGNHFESLEEAEKAVEKLKALAEAKEDGLKIKGYYYNHEDLVILADIGKCNKLTLDTLFGKEID